MTCENTRIDMVTENIRVPQISEPFHITLLGTFGFGRTYQEDGPYWRYLGIGIWECPADSACYKTELNTAALVCDRIIPTERPPLVDEDSANFCA
jgi:hypothetical protein